MVKRPPLSLTSKLLLFLSLQTVWFVLSCSSPPPINENRPLWRDNDNQPIAEPEFQEPPLAWMSFKRTGPDQLRELLDIDRNIRKLTGHPAQAKNTNSYDEVPNSQSRIVSIKHPS